MKYFKIKPLTKKSIYDFMQWEGDGENEGKSFIVEEMYRWGHAIIETEDDVTLEQLKQAIKSDTNQGHFYGQDYIIHDMAMDDGCSLYFIDCEGCDSEELEQKYEEDSDIESNWGYWNSDNWIEIIGPMEITEITEEIK